MTKVVVDASIIIAVVSNEPQKGPLIQMTQDVNLIAPHSIHWEIGNAFSAMFKRNRITIEDAIQAIFACEKIPIRFADIELDEALKLAHALNIYAYDAFIIRCAIKYKSPLISLDQKLLYAANMAKAQVLEVPQ
jgi:predicted nucleic acid-binding protein